MVTYSTHLGLFDVLPCSTEHDSRHIGLMYAKYLRDVFLRKSAGVQVQNLQNRRLVEFRHSIHLTPSNRFRVGVRPVPDSPRCSLRMQSQSMPVSSGLPSLSDHVPTIYGIRSEEQVPWVNAGRIVASGAVVKNAETVWDWSVVNDPRSAMGSHPFSIEPECPISAFGGRGCPAPTLAASIRLLQKTLLVFFGQLWQKGASHIRAHTRSLVRALGPLMRSLRSSPLLQSGGFCK